MSRDDALALVAMMAVALFSALAVTGAYRLFIHALEMSP